MTRARFDDLPAWLKAWVAERLGSPVVSATSQPGGYSPGTADRLVCADGTRGFLKAVHPSHNPESPDIHRAELANLRSMPDGIPVPRLIAGLDEQDWVVLSSSRMWRGANRRSPGALTNSTPPSWPFAV
ncbi:hypothetical protein [Tessaracoccus flavescens]|uniref:Aminoglycoside phosphotransferase domain-containing protein n=1 Tax=Tessaracoccus flavescens TaxID=399497 RepID=A0A1Q2CWI2_9ACTN|nr:hypothetical protein [Tessaracoccus flavescens]AQP50434.1 hypothetical protein BW733_05900 [Tessaracoccus flavescens]